MRSASVYIHMRSASIYIHGKYLEVQERRIYVFSVSRARGLLYSQMSEEVECIIKYIIADVVFRYCDNNVLCFVCVRSFPM